MVVFDNCFLSSFNKNRCVLVKPKFWHRLQAVRDEHIHIPKKQPQLAGHRKQAVLQSRPINSQISIFNP